MSATAGRIARRIAPPQRQLQQTGGVQWQQLPAAAPGRYPLLLQQPPNGPSLTGRRPSPPCPPQYEAGSAPAIALQATIERTEKRFASYGKAGLLCGADGLPHLISDPGLALRYGHAGEVFVSGWRCCSWLAGWLGSPWSALLPGRWQGAGRGTPGRAAEQQRREEHALQRSTRRLH
jgi:hypothetical protein